MRPRPVAWRAGPERRSPCACGRLTASGRSKAATSWPRAGRIPNTAGIGLDEAGVELDGRGYVRVNERLETSAPGVWAIGECAGSPQFTQCPRTTSGSSATTWPAATAARAIGSSPTVMFTDPPLARVGPQREPKRGAKAIAGARRQAADGRRAADAKRPARTRLHEGARRRDDDRILGFTMFGSEAGEVMAVVQTAMLAELPNPRLRDAVIAHLTIAEGLGPLSNAPARWGA